MARTDKRVAREITLERKRRRSEKYSTTTLQPTR